MGPRDSERSQLRAIRVLVVDDSPVIRRILVRSIDSSPEIEVVGEAADPYEARDLIVSQRPQVILLDIEMPRMDGLTFLGRIMTHHPLPVIIISAHTPSGSELALSALQQGAFDVLAKPVGQDQLLPFVSELREKIRLASVARMGPLPPVSTAPARPALPAPPAQPGASRTVVLGASTGGTQAIELILRALPRDAPPIAIVQHMPAHFTPLFAKRLDSLCDLHVKEASEEDTMQRGLALIAPGDRHMSIEQRGSELGVSLSQSAKVSGHRPSVDELFDSVATSCGPDSVGVLLTGMGADGARGLLGLREAGAPTVAQDERSCVVFGVPREAIQLDAAQFVEPLSEIPARILVLAGAGGAPSHSRDPAASTGKSVKPVPGGHRSGVRRGQRPGEPR